MSFKRLDDICESAFFGKCREASIKGNMLHISLVCPTMGKKWVGVALSYDYKIEEDKEVYYIKADAIQHGEKETVISLVLNLSSFPFRSTHWSILAVYEETGRYFSAKIQYSVTNSSGLRFIFKKDCYLTRGRNIVFCYRNGSGYLGLMYREAGKYDGWLTRLKEKVALKWFKHKKEQFDKRRIYLIYEKRCQKAQDNGYHLFRYIMDNNMEQYLGAEVYYVLEKQSVDRKKLKKYSGNVVNFMSLKFMLLFLASNLLISPDSRAHAYSWQPVKSLIVPRLSKKNHVFLGHGVLAFKRLNDSFTARSMKSVLCTVTSKQEADIVCNELGFSRDKIAITGYARFDVLKDTSGNSKDILIMPTHRSWLFGVERKVFTNSEYYRRYMEIINSPDMIRLLEETGVHVYFYVHPSIMEHTDAFSSVSDRIEVVPYGKYSLDDLMMKCKMLITDYSSIAWDMYYMDKPVIFYQYDEDKYMETWGSYIDLSKGMPGERAFDFNGILELTKQYIERGFEMKPEFEEVRKDMYAYIDDKNSYRICRELRKRNY